MACSSLLAASRHERAMETTFLDQAKLMELHHEKYWSPTAEVFVGFDGAQSSKEDCMGLAHEAEINYETLRVGG